jgi:aspartyl-tRNA(Asn)/glutamyl-tRNA(Gln) amidotransferase subunit C
MPKLKQADVEHLAHLARIELTEMEKRRFSEQLSAILDHVESLSQVAVDGVQPISQITDLENVMRADDDQVGLETLGREEALKNVADTKDGYVKMRGIFE